MIPKRSDLGSHLILRAACMVACCRTVALKGSTSLLLLVLVHSVGTVIICFMWIFSLFAKDH